MSGNKTVENEASVEDFINSVDNEQKRQDSRELLAMMQEITGCKPKMWGASMVGFGSYHYKYDSGREGDMLVTGFSPRKTAMALYVIPGFSDFEEQLAKLGPCKTGKSCLYLKNLAAVDRKVLKEIISQSVDIMKSRYDCRF
jgi:hypothetical protein